jgi:hypothetical protein
MACLPQLAKHAVCGVGYTYRPPHPSLYCEGTWHEVQESCASCLCQRAPAQPLVLARRRHCAAVHCDASSHWCNWCGGAVSDQLRRDAGALLRLLCMPCLPSSCTQQAASSTRACPHLLGGGELLGLRLLVRGLVLLALLPQARELLLQRRALLGLGAAVLLRFAELLLQSAASACQRGRSFLWPWPGGQPNNPVVLLTGMCGGGGRVWRGAAGAWPCAVALSGAFC